MTQDIYILSKKEPKKETTEIVVPKDCKVVIV